MNRIFDVTLLSLLGCFGIGAQDPAVRLEFEVASVKASPPPDGHGITVGCSGGPGTTDPGILTCENMPLSRLLVIAFDIDPDRLVSPDWMAQERFHVTARLPAGAVRQQLPEMWQRLLADRFKLAVHRESRVVPQYDLVVGKNGVKFEKAVEAEDPKAAAAEDAPRHAPMKVDRDGFPELTRPGMIGMNGHIRLYDTKMSMEQLARILSAQLGRPVSDHTGLAGAYEIRLSWIAEDSRGPGASPDGPNLPQAVQDQLGLRLEARRGPIDFVVVDHAEKTPIEN